MRNKLCLGEYVEIELLQGVSWESLSTQDFCFVLDFGRYHERVDEFLGFLSEDETSRARRYAVRSVFEEFVLTRGLLRILLGHALRRSPRELVFSENEWGKLFCLDSDVFFNVSHSRGYALVAVSRNDDIGVDLEYRRERVSRDHIAARFFSGEEQVWLREQAPDQIGAGFYDIWTGKEAVSKAMGLGMALPLSSYSVIPEEAQINVVVPGNKRFSERTTWGVRYVDVLDGYSVCVARFSCDNEMVCLRVL